jgi:hypothetical protein
VLVPSGEKEYFASVKKLDTSASSFATQAKLEPIFKTKAGHALKLAHVIRDYSEPLTASMAPNHHVMDAYALPRTIELRPELTIMVGGAFHEWEHFQPPAELLYHLQILLHPRRFFRTVDQLSERDHGDAKLIRELIEPLPQLSRSVLDDIDADVGVQHIAQHHNSSRSFAAGW